MLTLRRERTSYLLASLAYDLGLALMVSGGASILAHRQVAGAGLLFLAVVVEGMLGIRNSWTLAMQVDDPAERSRRR